jgi:hypothetical protein
VHSARAFRDYCVPVAQRVRMNSPPQGGPQRSATNASRAASHDIMDSTGRVEGWRGGP